MRLAPGDPRRLSQTFEANRTGGPEVGHVARQRTSVGDAQDDQERRDDLSETMIRKDTPRSRNVGEQPT